MADNDRFSRRNLLAAGGVLAGAALGGTRAVAATTGPASGIASSGSAA